MSCWHFYSNLATRYEFIGCLRHLCLKKNRKNLLHLYPWIQQWDWVKRAQHRAELRCSPLGRIENERVATTLPASQKTMDVESSNYFNTKDSWELWCSQCFRYVCNSNNWAELRCSPLGRIENERVATTLPASQKPMDVRSPNYFNTKDSWELWCSQCLRYVIQII